MQSTADKVLKESGRHEEGWCFSPKNFLDLAGWDALDKSFSRLVADGKIRRIGRGLYDIQRYNDLLQEVLSPSSDQIARRLPVSMAGVFIPLVHMRPTC